MKFFFTAALIIFSFVCSLKANELPKFKFGKINMDEMKSTICDIDTGAHAYFIFDIGLTEMEYIKDKGFRVIFNRHCRLKILDQNGYDAAEFSIPLYISTSSLDKESVGKIKAVTYNLEGNRIVETKLDKKDIFKEQKNENWKYEKFTMPNIKEGSVIEVEYTVYSDFYWNLQSWNFQHYIPTKISAYEVRIPEYFNYNKEMKGYESINVDNSGSSSGSITFLSNGNNSSGSSFESINYSVYHTVMLAQNVPAFKKEPYIDAPSNYIAGVKFELASTQYPNRPFESYTTTWDKICEKLFEYDSFGLELDNLGFCKNKLEELKGNYTSDLEKSKAIFNWVKEKTKWNEDIGVFCSNGIRKTFNDGVGSTGDINILLTTMLKAAGLQAYPVVLRSRYTGFLPITYPSISELNYVITAVDIEGKRYLLDATEDAIPFDFIPERCINRKGILIKEKNTNIEWIDLNQKMSSEYASYANVEINVDGTLEGNISYKRKGYNAFQQRQNLEKDEVKFIEEIENDFEGLEIEEYEFVNEKDLDEPFCEKYTVTISDVTTVAGDMLYFNPCLNEKYSKNPFKLQERKYPVDFAYPQEITVSNSFAIPEGWEVESKPENLVFALPDNAGFFAYNINELTNMIQLVQKFKINKSIFVPSEYDSLKEFYRKVVAKQQEQIVLKKI